MLTNFEYWKIGIFCLIILLSIILQYTFRDPIERVSTPIILNFQDESLFTKIMHYIGLLGSRKAKSLMLAIVFSVCNFYHAFIYVLSTYTTIFFTAWLKIILQEPRPFWIEPDVKALTCEFGFGYPSNHVLPTVPSVFMFFEIMYYRFQVDKSAHPSLYYWSGFFVCLVTCVLSGFSRMIVGVHSLDQIVFGLFIGFAFYYFFLHVIDYDLKNNNHYLQLFMDGVSYKKLLLGYIVAFIIFLIHTTLLDIRYNPEWTVMINEKCGYTPMLTPFYGCFIGSGPFFIIVFSIVGIVYNIQSEYVKNKHFFIVEYTHDNLHYNNGLQAHDIRLGRWNDTSFIVSFIRFLVVFFIISTMILLSLFTKKLLPVHFMSEYFCNEMFAHILLGFILFGFGKKIGLLLNLANKSEMKKVESIQ